MLKAMSISTNAIIAARLSANRRDEGMSLKILHIDAANACLIEAAPELLKALKNLLLSSQAKSCNHIRDREAAALAVAKAQGEVKGSLEMFQRRTTLEPP